MMRILGFLFSVLSLPVVGYGFCSLFRFPSRRGFFETFALSTGLGAGAIPMLAFWLSLMGIRLSFPAIALAAAPFWAVSIVAWVRPGRAEKRFEPPLKKGSPLLMGLLTFWLAAVLVVAAWNTLGRLPLGDGLDFWALKSQILFHQGTVCSEDFYSPGQIHPHKDYPLLIPLLKVWIMFGLGEGSEAWARVVYLLLFISLAFLLYCHSKRIGGTLPALLFTALFCSTPRIGGHIPASVSSGYSDLPLSLFFTASALYLTYWLKEPRIPFLAISGLFTTFAVHTKNEGVPFALLAMGAALLFGTIRYRWRGAIPALIYSFWIGASAIPWFLYRSGLASLETNYVLLISPDNVLGNLDRIPSILFFFLREFIQVQHWGFLWIFIGAAGILNLPRTVGKELLPLVFVLAGMAGTYTLVYVVCPESPLYYTTGARLLLQLAPIGFLIGVHGAMEILDERGLAESRRGD